MATDSIDKDPKSRYPHTVLLPYLVLYLILLILFYAYGLTMGLIIIAIGMVVSALLPLVLDHFTVVP